MGSTDQLVMNLCEFSTMHWNVANIGPCIAAPKLIVWYMITFESIKGC